MAFSISIGIRENSRNTTNRTANVTVDIYATWSGGTWNHEAPTSTLTIDGTTYNYNARLNPNNSTSGSNTLYSKTVDVPYNSDGNKTLNVSATYNWRGVSASASKALTPLSGGSGTAAATNVAVVDKIGIQTGTDSTVYVTWRWDRDNTENYQVRWYYDTGDSVWFLGSDSTTEFKQSTYGAPENAKRVKVFIKPISKTKTVDGNETSYWTVGWSTEKIYNLSDAPPSKPSVPEVEVTDNVLTAELDNLDVHADSIQFQIVKNNSTVFKTGTADIVTGHASYSCTVDNDSEYKVRCRSHKDGVYSEWSEYSGNVQSMPSAPSAITVCKGTSETSVYLEWTPVKGITTYDIEYTTNKNYFDGSDGTTVESGIEFTHYEKTGLETGKEYFFRVRSVDDNVSSKWSEIKSVTIGKPPAAPTTWSLTTVVAVGEPLNLYWVHNSEDGSSQTYAELELIVDGVRTTEIIPNSTEEDEKDKTSVYSIDTNKYEEGAKVEWKVRTAGVTDSFGEWSVQRVVDIYAPPTLDFGVTDENGDIMDVLSSFPFYVAALAGPNTQMPIGYHVTVTSNNTYETVDDVGNARIISKGEQIYSKHFDTSDPLLVEFSASNIDLENNMCYTVVCSVQMNSGLSAEASSEFTVAWEEVEYVPNAEIGIDKEAYTASICPFCVNAYGQMVPDLLLAVYRREFDGSFTELATGLENGRNTYITDPHPSLDYARYRIVAKSNLTGAVGYYDLPGYPVKCSSVIIQWNEAWSTFDTNEESEMEQPAWAGSMLKLPYNVDVTDNHKPDVSLIEYVGRKHPVSYYGTQRGTTSTWNVEIPKSDKETLYALRRLSNWMGDVYVREPSGTGYWANITLSYPQKHLDVTIPVTITIARVEGGA
jgi:hypothetical protein